MAQCKRRESSLVSGDMRRKTAQSTGGCAEGEIRACVQMSRPITLLSLMRLIAYLRVQTTAVQTADKCGLLNLTA